MFCKNCGKQLPDGAVFCSGCGARLTAAPGAETPQPQAASQPPARPAPPPAPPKKKKSKAPLIIISVLVVAILGALAALYFTGRLDNAANAVKEKISAAVSGKKEQAPAPTTAAPVEVDGTDKGGKKPYGGKTDSPSGSAPSSDSEAPAATPRPVPEKQPAAHKPVEQPSASVGFRRYEGGFADYEKLWPTWVEASSELTDKGVFYGAWNVCDGDLSTSWQEDADGPGEGEYIILGFDEAPVSAIKFNVGYQKKLESYYNNYRPAGLLVSFSGGEQFECRFDDVCAAQSILLDAPIRAQWVSFRILDSYPSEKWNDNCISEITLYADRAHAPSANGLTVVIDPGHSARPDPYTMEPIGPGAEETKLADGGGTVGVATGIPEYELNLAVAFLLREELEARGYTVVLTRERNDVTLGNIARASCANDIGADAFIRLHANGSDSPESNGVCVLCQTRDNPYNGSLRDESYALSQYVLDYLCAATGQKKMFVWERDDMAGINWAQVPCTLVEMGFMTNPAEDELMAQDWFRADIARGIADGVDRYFGL